MKERQQIVLDFGFLVRGCSKRELSWGGANEKTNLFGQDDGFGVPDFVPSVHRHG